MKWVFWLDIAFWILQLRTHGFKYKPFLNSLIVMINGFTQLLWHQDLKIHDKYILVDYFSILYLSCEMGNLCVGPQLPKRLQVLQFPDSIPHDPSYRLFRGNTNRYSDLSVINIDAITFIFTLKIEQHHELQVSLPVLNEIAHRAVYFNYKLNILKQIIIDPLDDTYTNTLIAVKNQLTGVEYSLRIIPFRSYNSIAFKKGLQEIWIHQKKLSKRQRNLFLTLEDAFIYGLNPDQQVIVLLFQRTNSNLFNIGQYRRQSNWDWTLPQKLTIFQNLLESCQKLKEFQIVHRDIRANNIFFLQHLNRYVLGNFSTGRQIYENDHDDLLTVYGVQALSDRKVTHFISEKANMGIYNINSYVYSSLDQVLSYLETLSTVPTHLNQQEKIIHEIHGQLHSHEHFNSIIAFIRRQIKDIHSGHKIELYEDHLISKLSERLLAQKYKKTVEDCQFKTFQLLGYYKQFSEMAHKIIQKNNIDEQPFKNAYILKNLGYFYEQNGTGGTQYLLNSCILFCRQIQLDLQYRLFDDAEEHLNQAEQLYLKLSTINDFSLNLIEINRLRSLVKMHRGKTDPNLQNQSILLINKTLNLAADKNLSIEKQMKLFLSWGVIYRQSNKVDLAQQRLKNGLSICQNTAAFSSISTAILLKSHFLYELGIIYFNKMKELHNPQKSIDNQQYNKYDYKGRAQSYFKLSLEIRQRESTNSFEVIENHLILGSFYLMTNSYSESKTHYKKALIKLKLIKDKISDQIMIQLYYDLGSVCYKMKEFKDAQAYYSNSIKILEQTQIDDYWMYCIKGNLALCKIQCGQNEMGYRELEKIKQIIRSKKGVDHYDYIFLQAQEEAIRSKMY